MSNRKLVDNRMGEIQGVNLVTICWSGDEEDYKISGMLVTDRAALTIIEGSVEVCFVDLLTNGEYELVQCVAPLFHVGEDAESYPEVFANLQNLSLFDFCRKYKRFDLMIDDA
ncbi:hypothetical protein [Tumebacillus flagellatus]|uniref:Uncharacterized protein n=1 Tax=Tumebacillus flagellatus TaxID=1157490 RepID=A0A074LLY4_9BACL|nr:hypothetical protein [Tumebacillus flagellatus]KEO80913.1 hypothetical protein EL26_23695 [Tumebacillus flagellatus]